jgi:S-adenosylmethionine:tRNA ribosyltransferase-isomerase
VVEVGVFHYTLPESKIAQRPVGLEGARSGSKLLHAVGGANGGVSISDHHFVDLKSLLRRGDLLVLNNSRVLPCRFFAKHEAQGKVFEILLVHPGREEFVWEALARPMRKLKPGDMLRLSEHLHAQVLGRTEDEQRVRLAVRVRGDERSFAEVLAAEGTMPIPPYIRRGHADELDRELYQTVYAEVPGSVAAPTAGLHFTKDLLAELGAQGMSHACLTLHVGPASFLPIKSDELSAHHMLVENYSIPEETKKAIINTKERGGSVAAVGTTSVRALESAALEGVLSGENIGMAETKLLITPGFHFQIVDRLITNFHQPGSTHLLLVAAFIGRQNTEQIYSYALQHDYRFLSYGDAMLLDHEQ